MCCNTNKKYNATLSGKIYNLMNSFECHQNFFYIRIFNISLLIIIRNVASLFLSIARKKNIEKKFDEHHYLIHWSHTIILILLMIKIIVIRIKWYLRT